ncbi:hypothetical protein FJU08_18525 [Martelella alba]|uniref:Metalloprotease StcE beta-sandwich domain-containing protein n=1 Tax=Martelella alba TaxID=2590451 RepID=A0A506U622_9HYPH|nr:hypothetical protein [Martelella alba]TPW28039.1 hypothetical protein FJU08_18525 [Martelella alba]
MPMPVLAGEDCASARVAFEAPSQLFALQGSLFSDRLYVQGDETWTPTEIVAKATLPSGQPATDCHLHVYPRSEGDGRFFYSDGEETDENGVVRGYWFAETNPSAELVAENVATPSLHDTLKGAVPATPFANAGGHVRYIYYKTDGPHNWSTFSLDVTPVTSGHYMYYAAMFWTSGYLGLQQTRETFDAPHSRKLIMTLWDNGYGLPEVVRDPYGICGEAHQGTAEGDNLRCFSDYDFYLGDTYTFTVKAEHVVPDALDYTLHISGRNGSGFPEDFDVLTLRVPNRSDYYPPMPASFLEDYEAGYDSCADVQQTLIIYSNIWYTPAMGSGRHPISDVFFDRGYDAKAGGPDMCFNYDYGDTDILPVDSGFGGSQAKVDGFYMSTGGMDLVGSPQVGNYWDYAGADWKLDNPYLALTTYDQLQPLQSPDYLTELFVDHPKISVTTYDGGWLNTLILPDHVAEGSKFLLNVGSTLAVNLQFNGQTENITTGNTAELVYSDNRWMVQRIGAQQDYYVLPEGSLEKLDRSGDYLYEQFQNHQWIEADTADGNWVGAIVLPAGVEEQSRFKLVVNSTWAVDLQFGGKTQNVKHGETAELAYIDGQWQLQSLQ